MVHLKTDCLLFCYGKGNGRKGEDVRHGCKFEGVRLTFKGDGLRMRLYG